jgi:putative colanic acid biosynthesis UDP-glucose lipid carrier transferase
VSNHVVFRTSLPIGVVAVLQAAATPLLAVLSLRLVALLYDVSFDRDFVMLSVLVAAISFILFDQSRTGNGNGVMGAPRMPLTTGILARWVALLAILLMIGFATKLSAEFSRRVLFTWCVVTPVPLVLVHLLLRELRRKVVMDPSNARRVVFAGVNDVSLSLAARLRCSSELCMTVDGFFEDRSPERLSESTEPAKVIGRLHEIGAYVKANRIDVIFVALPIRHVSRVMQLLDDLRDTTASIYYVPDIFVFDLIQARAGEIHGIPVVALCETPFAGYRGAIKRAMDIGVALTALLVLLPLLIAVGIAVKMSSPGPAIFRQRRYGLDGQEIVVFKFRTMTVTEDGPRVVQATRDDERVTRIGRVLRRYSLDELPQLLNVIQGRMSLIGPRPHAVAHNEEYRKLIKGYMIRHKVLPGITGLAQVNGCRGETQSLEDMQARIRFDLEYLRRWSIGLDIQILLKTAAQLFTDKKAY